MDRIRGNSNDTQHVLASSRPSYRPGRPVIQAVIGHAPHPSSPYRFPSLPQFFKHATPAVVYSLTHPPSRSPSRPISSRRTSRSYTGLLDHAVFVIPFRRVLLVGSSYSLPLHRPGIEHGIAIAPSASLYISIASLYYCIFISFIYIAYIIFIIYIH